MIAVTTAKFTLFNIQSVIDLTQKDSMDLKTWGTQKTMVYLVIPDNDTTFRFLSALFFSMVFSTLTRQADVDFKGQLLPMLEAIWMSLLMSEKSQTSPNKPQQLALGI